MSILDYCPNFLLLPYMPQFKKYPTFANFDIKYLRQAFTSIVQYYCLGYKIKLIRYQQFCKKYLRLTPLVYQENINRIVCLGSDQIWNPRITNWDKTYFYSNYPKGNAKVISYAASIGNDHSTQEELDFLRANIKNIDCISVREDTAQKVLSSICDKPITTVVDPTLLLKSTDTAWQQLISDTLAENEYSILTREGYKILAYRSPIGYINAVALPDNVYQNEISLWRMKMLVIIAAAFLIFGLSVVYLYRMICRPLGQFRKQMEQIGETLVCNWDQAQAQDAIKTEAERCGMYYVNERWLGGMLTNFKTIQSRVARLKAIEKMAEDGTFEVLPKKEVIALKKEWEKLERNLGGIKEMKRLPDAIFVVDPKKERICVQEAHTLGITLIGIADTNCDPEELDYVIPGNDDAIRAVKLIVSKMADAVIEANQGEAEAAPEASEETEAVSEAEAEA